MKIEIEIDVKTYNCLQRIEREYRKDTGRDTNDSRMINNMILFMYEEIM